MSEIRDVLEFWLAPANRPQWFKKDLAFDDEVRRRFEAVHERAAAGRFAQWQNTPEGALALLLCLDQFPRNMYRGTPRAFATDEKARLVADWAVDRGFDMTFKDEQVRLFFYLPFEHSEDLDDQHRAVELTRQRCQADPEIRPGLSGSAVLVGEHQSAVAVQARPVIGRQVEIGQIVIAQIQAVEPGNPGAGGIAAALA